VQVTSLGFALTLLSLLAVCAFWLSPAAARDWIVAGLSILALALISPASAAWLGATTILTPPLMQIAQRWNMRGLFVLVWTSALVAILFLSRLVDSLGENAILWVGGAYFTLRHIHVLFEWWYGRLAVPSLASYVRYQLFLPVIMSGPINRFQNFERQCARRRWDQGEFWSGAERVLIGLAVAIFVGTYAMDVALDRYVAPYPASAGFMNAWLHSVGDWFKLFVQFTATTDIALGLSLMMGLRLEENFNQPWRAFHLLDFWSRWHMTLTSWVRDYVYGPITAYCRSPLLGVSVAMLVIGLWHQLSVYYVLWAVWQTLGIVLTRIYINAGDAMRLGRLPKAIQVIGGPVHVLVWLSLAKPVIQLARQWANL
jgi:D-alanyl-lipoteichoic acid acyltransferase DltB (MBOAT superfamily)